MHSPSRRRMLVAAVTAGAASLVLAACTGGTTLADPGSDGSTGDAGATTVTFRLWDDVAAPAYAESFDAFSAAHPDLRVQVEVVPRGEYADRLREDMTDGDMADVFWATPTMYPAYAAAGDLVEVGADPDEAVWERSVVDLFTYRGTLWGVPQLWDSVALYYNEPLVAAADVDPSRLAWTPGGGAGDTLQAASRALTVDTTGRHPGEAGFDPGATQSYGFNAGADLFAIVLPFLAQNGVRFRDGQEFTFATPDGEAAFQYLVDLVRAQVAPPAAQDGARDGADAGPARDLFTHGRLALFQSSSQDLRTLVQDAGPGLRIAPMVAGPQGRPGVLTGVAAVGNAHSAHDGATREVLRWLGSADGQAALASQGVGVPAVAGAQEAYAEYWAARGVDVQPFLDAAREPGAPAPAAIGVDAGIAAVQPVLDRMFRGEIPVPEAVAQAQQAGNAALATPSPEP
ncbi:ABC transporter substrate-binding protein [Georgenia sp. SYP-B2076]|uniref:ABC transporter substrate-binding protein n=1 Tax=Georgenia sp. SYP-B2076 TaxID=2495881 RepID=UPI000F8C81D6|nr:extracellular solute-binding protein [Georgenia sp. SYP-B2076]